MIERRRRSSISGGSPLQTKPSQATRAKGRGLEVTTTQAHAWAVPQWERFQTTSDIRVRELGHGHLQARHLAVGFPRALSAGFTGTGTRTPYEARPADLGLTRRYPHAGLPAN